MDKITIGELRQKLSDLLLFTLLFSIFLLPNFQIISGYPKIHLSDILTPFFVLYVWLNYKPELISTSKSFLKVNILMLMLIGISLLINHRFSVLRDDFELLKQLKFIFVFLFVLVAASKVEFIKLFRFIFVLVFLFNFFHFTNFLDFNSWIFKFYGGESQFKTFGLNSIGLPDSKRIIGTVLNPNNNAILFLFFVVVFYPEKMSSANEKLYFVLAIFGTLACQSRTGFIALIIVLLLGIIIKNHTIKFSIFLFLIIVCMYFLLLKLGNSYLNTISGNVMSQNSVQSRIHTWSYIWEMIKQKPIFGYSPYKDYFYNNNLYSENEYVLYTWRYGILGLISYISILWTSFYLSFKKRFFKYGFSLCMFTIVLAITALTNNPLCDTMIYMMFAFMAGVFFSDNLNTGG